MFERHRQYDIIGTVPMKVYLLLGWVKKNNKSTSVSLITNKVPFMWSFKLPFRLSYNSAIPAASRDNVTSSSYVNILVLNTRDSLSSFERR